jgi:hypothetical protein
MGEFVNTFNKGMTSDVNVIYQPNGTYRYMKNCQLISQDGNNYVIKDCLGNVKKFTINRRYNTDYTHYDTYPMCIGFISFVDQLIVFSTNAQGYTGSDLDPIGGYGEIGILNYNNYREGIEPNVVTGNYNDGYVPLYHHIDLNFSMLKQIEGFAYEENPSSKQVYWTDNFNEPRCFNIADPIFTTYIASGSLSLTAGTQYMIVEGAVEYPVASGDYYGPGLPLGNIITTNGVNNTYTDLTTPTPTAKVISYYPYQLLNFTPSRSMGNIKFNSYGSGNKYCGAKMYFYRLSNSTNGINTSWSYGSNPISVETDNSLVATPVNPYFDLTGGGTSTTLLNSGKSVKIDIDNIDTSFDTIQVACAEFDQTLDVPRTISEVYSGAITGTSMTIEDTGSVLSTLTLSDITLFPASILRCKTITTNKNYILVGNTLERQEFDFDTSGITSAEIKGTFPVHEADETLCNNVLTYTSVAPTPGVNPTFIIEGCNYVVTSIAGGNVVYDANPYIVGEVILGTATTAITIPAGSQVRPCVSINKYTAINSTTAYPERPNYIQLYDATAGNVSWSYRDPAVSALKKGYWGKEKYRFGILFYDKKGNPFYVRHITDFTFSDPETTPIIEQKTTGSYDYYFLNQRAISFSNIEIPKEIVDSISGFSIVRAERDKRIITEGFLMQVGDNGTDCIPIAGPYARRNSQYSGSLTQYMTLVCPDRLTGYSMPNYTTGSFIEGCFWLRATDFENPPASNLFMKSVDQDDQVESRYFNQYLTSDGVTRLNKITALADVNEYDTLTNFGSSNRNYKNFAWFQTLALFDIENSCVVPASVADLSDHAAVAGARTVIEIEDPLLYRGGTFPYGDLTPVTGATVDKLVVDVVIENTNQYGGTSDTALANTLYISTGHFQPINATVIAETNDTNDPNNYTKLTFNNVDIWGGDCFTCLVDYGHSLYNTDFSGAPYSGTNSWGIKFPMQCNVNYDLRRGRTVANNKMGYAAGMAAAPPVGVVYKDTFSNIRLESFEYNKGYSSDGNIFNYPALPINLKNIGEFKFRVRYAGVKFPNELINSFRTFLTNDYKDVDGQGGEINNIRTKDGRVIVWQNKLVSTVPVLERQLLTGLSGAPTTLGTGGVVDRYDPLNSYFGNQHQQGLTQTEYGFAWFDMRRKAFVIMDINAGIIEVSKIDGLKGFFDEVFLEASETGIPDYVPVLNSPIYKDTSSRPLVGLGITGVYDPKFKTTYLTFKFKLLKHVFENNYEYGPPKDFTIAYNHVDRFFVGFFDWTPAISHNHNQIVLSVNNPKSSKYYGSDMLDAGITSNFVVGDTLSYDNVEYVVISPITVTEYPLIGDEAPDYPNSTYFKKVNDTSQIWVHNQEISTSSTEYQYNKFFGKVVDNEVHIIINPKTKDPFAVLNIEQAGNLVNVTEISTSNDTQSAIDSNISPGNRFYRNIWDNICSSLPLGSKGRIVGDHLKIRFYKKNWTSDPTVLTGLTRIFTLLKSFFEEKR